MAGYSIIYKKKGDFTTYAVDWEWLAGSEWSCSSKEYEGVQWYFDGKLVLDEPLVIHLCIRSGGEPAAMRVDDKGQATFISGKGETIIKTCDEDAYRALLAHFGLENWADEFPPEKIKTMSPKELALARREKERLHRLARKEMISDALGRSVPAEEYKEYE